MLNEREVQYRMKCALNQRVPFLNYGLTIACMQRDSEAQPVAISRTGRKNKVTSFEMKRTDI